MGGIRGSGLTNICGWPVGFAKRGFDGMHRSSVLSYREGSNAEPKVENVRSSAQSHLKPKHEIKLSDAASVVQPADLNPKM